MERVNVVYGFICSEEKEKVLMVHNVGSSWSLPGGMVEQGETLEEAVIREAKEETGLTIAVEHIVAVNEAFVKEKGHHVLFFTFKAKIIAGEFSIRDYQEISEIRWVDIPTANQLMPYYPNGVEHLMKSSSPYTYQN